MCSKFFTYVKVTLFLYMIKHHTMKIHEERKCSATHFYLLLNGGEWLTSSSATLPPGDRALDTHWIDGCMDTELIFTHWQKEQHLPVSEVESQFLYCTTCSLATILIE